MSVSQFGNVKERREGEIFFNRAAINDESIPPDKKTPKGTSDKL